MTLVLKRSLSRPGTHALVIGAGVYEGEWGTNRQRMINNAAQQLVVWLATRYRNPTAEIATIDVYLNSPIYADLDHVPGFTDQNTSGASHQQVEAAAETWMKRANAYEENIALFFFAGRVFDQCPDTSLTFEDFRANRWNPSLKSGVASFLSIPAAMRGCRAHRQLYLLDVDREGLPEETRVELLLRSQPELSPPPHQTIIYSAAAGQRAFHESAAGNFHAFVPSLTDFLDSADPDPSTGAITVDRLAAGVAEQMSVLNAKRGVAQRIEFESTSDFDFHYPLRPGAGLGLKQMCGRPEPDPLVPKQRDQVMPPPATSSVPPLAGQRLDEGRTLRRRLLTWIAQHRDSFAVQLAATTIGGLSVAAIVAVVVAIVR